ncbi:DNA polymerase epsilon subunit 2 [Reticulomyxa filosa]|uniref:DNA polymerase II subunit 2 n=1 Tax=Reticulomyxa filosa TaxID=46433 RepID=X6ND91_RETFI|nr:DNA polymerase epsilon subunit 2 [Reticulomyxa filosa]|eukprot:ETO23739.1 DNA polymerase epsilon subunit 2 [Reticulomyxa filosa]
MNTIHCRNKHEIKNNTWKLFQKDSCNMCNASYCSIFILNDYKYSKSIKLMNAIWPKQAKGLQEALNDLNSFQRLEIKYILYNKKSRKEKSTGVLNREITKKFKRLGLSLQKDALKGIMELCEEKDGSDEKPVEELIDEVSGLVVTRNLTSPIVSLEDLRPIIDQFKQNTKQASYEKVQIKSAFDLPRYSYKRVGKQFVAISKGPTHEGAQDQMAMYRHRYEVLLQRTLRNKLFTKSTFKQTERTITGTTELVGTHDEVCIFGMLCELEEGSMFLQDLNGSVKIDIKDAAKHEGLFTWGSYVLAQGSMNKDGIFKANTLGTPAYQTREDALKTFPILDFVPFEKKHKKANTHIYNNNNNNNNNKLELIEKKETNMFVFLSNVYLDQSIETQKISKIIDYLTKMFDGYSSLSVLPSLFVLMGNFSKERLGCNAKDMKRLANLFDNLADLICKYPKLVSSSEFVFIPGPNDPNVGNVLPQPGFPPSLTKKLHSKLRVHFPSNPCRIYYCTQEIVIFRDDLLQKMRRKCVIVPNMKPQQGTDISHHLARTILDQAHLCPLPLTTRPIMCNFDHALMLYPPPTTLILADSHTEYRYLYNDTQVICPGEFVTNGSFITYIPSTKQNSFCRIENGDSN